MDLTWHVDNLGRELARAVETGGEEARAVAERLTVSLESAIRLTLLETLSAAADEITRDLAPGSVELRLRGRDPQFVVTPRDQPVREGVEGDTGPGPGGPGEPKDPPPSFEDSATARVNFRLPEPLKVAIEEAAAKEGRSVNAWLIRVASAALHEGQGAHSERRGKRGAQRYTGWVS